MRLVLEHRLCHGGHPVLRWNMDNAYVRADLSLIHILHLVVKGLCFAVGIPVAAFVPGVCLDVYKRQAWTRTTPTPPSWTIWT